MYKIDLRWLVRVPLPGDRPAKQHSEVLLMSSPRFLGSSHRCTLNAAQWRIAPGPPSDHCFEEGTPLQFEPSHLIARNSCRVKARISCRLARCRPRQRLPVHLARLMIALAEFSMGEKHHSHVCPQGRPGCFEPSMSKVRLMGWHLCGRCGANGALPTPSNAHGM